MILLYSVDDNVLPRLSLLAEVLGTKALPGSLDLITHLLETLNKVVQSASPTQVDVSYIEQLLMSAVENAAEKIVVCEIFGYKPNHEPNFPQEMPNLSPGAIRLDILVELIRGGPTAFFALASMLIYMNFGTSC